MAEEKLMTEAEFDKLLRQWAQQVHSSARMVLESGTNGTGELANSLYHYVDAMRNKEGRHIAFRFAQYGVFRQYGAGRGWIIVNGIPVRGRRVVSIKDRYKMHAWGTEAREMLSRGFSHKDVRSAKLVDGKYRFGSKREPLDWLDGTIVKKSAELADISVRYFGDRVLRQLAENLNKAKINKS